MRSEFPLIWSGGRPGDDYVPNTFDATAPPTIEAVPLSKDEPWETISLHYQTMQPSLIAGIFPAFTQLGTRFEHSMRTIGLPAATVAEEQMRVPIALLESLAIGGIVLRQGALQRCREEVARVSPTAAPYYQVILSPTEAPTVVGEHIFHEIHLVPGMVGLFQCQHLAAEGKGMFHLSDRFSWKHDGSTLMVSDPADKRFLKAILPRRFAVEDTGCPCGESFIRVKHL